jgi:hypothetical protein
LRVARETITRLLRANTGDADPAAFRRQYWFTRDTEVELLVLRASSGLVLARAADPTTVIEIRQIGRDGAG